MRESGMIRAMKIGVEYEMTAKVNNARALFTKSILKVLASTCNS